MNVRHRQLTFLVAALTAIGPFTIDTYLPSFPEMATSLATTALGVQQSLTAYLVPFALMNLWHGAISDAVGRRRVVLVALAVYTLASLGCAFSTGIEMLWGFRAGQGVASGVGLVVGRAIVRDVSEGAGAQRVLSWVAVLYLVAPAVAPVLGGWLHTWWGWRSAFVFLALLGATLWGWAWGWLPETLPREQRRPFHAGYLLRAYGATFRNTRFLALALAVALNFAGLFLYIASAPVFLMRHLGLHETEFFWQFGPTTAGLCLGGAISGRMAGRWSRGRTITAGFALLLSAAAANVAWHAFHPPGLPGSVIPLCVYSVGVALAAPSLTLIGLDLFPDRKGLASSCQAFLLTGGNSLTAGLIAPLAQGSALDLALAGAALALAGAVAAGWAALPRPR